MQQQRDMAARGVVAVVHQRLAVEGDVALEVFHGLPHQVRQDAGADLACAPVCFRVVDDGDPDGQFALHWLRKQADAEFVARAAARRDRLAPPEFPHLLDLLEHQLAVAPVSLGCENEVVRVPA